MALRMFTLQIMRQLFSIAISMFENGNSEFKQTLLTALQIWTVIQILKTDVGQDQGY